MSDHQAPDPPEHLSPRAAELWRQYVPERCKSPGRRAVAQAALESLDRADAARVQVEREGMTWTTEKTGAVHVHPLLKVERENRAAFVKLWRELRFDFNFQAGDLR